MSNRASTWKRAVAAPLTFFTTILAAQGIVGQVVAATPASAATTATSPGALLGIYRQARTTWNMADVKASISQVESDIGRKFDIDSHYYPWASAFPDWKQTWDADNGRIPMVSWGGTNTSEINSGSLDSVIKARADGVAAYNQPMFLRWFWEMDAKNTDTMNRVGSQADFIAAWRHIHDIFVQEGAVNAKFVWCPNAYWFTTGWSQTFYPGDAYVDWICADGYNWAPAKAGAPWESFSQIFSPFYAWASQRGKPIMIGETAAQERTPGEKAAWISDLAATVPAQFPQVRALVYFDALSSANFGGSYDWRVDSSSTSYAALKALGANPYFNPSHDEVLGGSAPASVPVVPSPAPSPSETAPTAPSPSPSSTSSAAPAPSPSASIVPSTSPSPSPTVSASPAPVPTTSASPSPFPSPTSTPTGGTSTETTTGTADLSGDGTLFGAYRQPRTGWSRDEVEGSIGQLENALGRHLDVDSAYYHWDWAFPDWKQSWDAANGRIPMVSWAGTSSTQVTGGSLDSWIRARADGVRSFGKPMFLRYFWEMDAQNADTQSRAGTPAQFVAAWRHIHDIFVKEGATNAKFVWCPNAWGFSTGRAADFYPGDAYVDWICADGYNWSPAKPWPWAPFAEIFSDFYRWGAARGKPLMIGETGVLERGAGDKAGWLASARTAIETQFPKIHALIYFDADSSANFGGQYNWKVDSSGTAFAAFAAMGADPHFSPSHSAILSGRSGPATPKVTRPLLAFQHRSRFPVAWRSKTTRKVASYSIRYKQARITGRFHSYSRWLSRTTRTKASFKRLPGRTYCFSVRARYSTGHLSTWSAPRCTAVPLDDRGLRVVRGFHRRVGSHYYRGDYSVARRHGATIRKSGIRARRIAVMVARCPGCGSVDVYWRGHLVKRVDLAASRLHRHVLVQVARFRSLQRGALSIRVASRGKRVVVDGISANKA